MQSSLPSWWFYVRNVLAACAGAVLVAWALRGLGPIETSTSLALRLVADERERCEVMFIGPSYVISQIYPEPFEQEAERNGRKLEACTFGDTAMRGAELWVYLGKLLDLGFPRLSLMVIDITLGGANFEQANWYTGRLIEWHTWDATWMSLADEKAEGQLTWVSTFGHLGHMAANYLNLGRGDGKLAPLAVLPRALVAAGVPLELPETDVVRRARDKGKGLQVQKERQSEKYMASNSEKTHRRRVKRMIGKKRTTRDDLVDDAYPHRLRDEVRKRGVEAIFIQAPVWRAKAGTMSQSRPDDPIMFIDFNDPERFPELYDRRNRGRTSHVSWSGGVEYSKQLARLICQFKAQAEPRTKEQSEAQLRGEAGSLTAARPEPTAP